MVQFFGQLVILVGWIVYDDVGNFYFVDMGNYLICMIDIVGIVYCVVGQLLVDGIVQFGYVGDGGVVVDVFFDYLVDFDIVDDGMFYFIDVRNYCVRVIYFDGMIDCVVGMCGENGYVGDGGFFEDVVFNFFFGLEWVNGCFYVVDIGNSVIRVFNIL